MKVVQIKYSKNYHHRQAMLKKASLAARGSRVYSNLGVYISEPLRNGCGCQLTFISSDNNKENTD